MRVLIAVDSSAVAEEVLVAAAKLFHAADELHVLTVTDPREAHETMSETGSLMNVAPLDVGTTSGSTVPSRIVFPVAAESALQAAERLRGEHLLALGTLVRRVFPAGLKWQGHLVADEDPAEAILRTARMLGVDGIAMGTRGRTGFPHALLGSVAEEVVRHSDVPVLVVRDGMHAARLLADARPVAAAGSRA